MELAAEAHRPKPVEPPIHAKEQLSACVGLGGSTLDEWGVQIQCGADATVGDVLEDIEVVSEANARAQDAIAIDLVLRVREVIASADVGANGEEVADSNVCTDLCPRPQNPAAAQRGEVCEVARDPETCLGAGRCRCQQCGETRK